MKSTDSALSSDDTGPCSSSDITPSSETSLSDMSPAATKPSAVPLLSGESRSASKQLTELAQLVQEHYAYTSTTDPDGAHAKSNHT